MRPLITAGATKKGVIARKKKKYKKKSVPRTGFFIEIKKYSGRKLLTASMRRFQAILVKTASERISKSIFNIIIDFYSLHKNTNFLAEIAARNCGFCSIASVGARIYGFVSSDAHAASGRKQLFAACLRRSRCNMRYAALCLGFL